ncbi:MAG TPA: HD domain-containing phosphohydrolase [Longimicrobiales bacterium]|nr:HD domain-containing phosphohydrolase [Longimicrobiales bacterium]
MKDERRSGARTAIHESGYSALVLDRLARHTCRILDCEQAWIVVRDRTDPRTAIAVAAHGLDQLAIGERIGTDEGVAGLALSGRAGSANGGGPLVVDSPGEASASACAPVSWRGSVRAALCVTSTRPARRFGQRDLEELSELADLVASALEHADRQERPDALVAARVDALAAAMDMRDGYTAQHSDEVVDLALEVGARLGLSGAALVELEFAARLHDVGKIAVPDAILRKEGHLDDGEWEMMRCHPVWGAESLQRIPGLEVVATLVRFHHERYDGGGYPDGLAGDRIPLASRIICACDAYKAITSDRPYRPARSAEQALAEIDSGAGTQFDPRVAETLAEAVSELGQA